LDKRKSKRFGLPEIASRSASTSPTTTTGNVDQKRATYKIMGNEEQKSKMLETTVNMEQNKTKVF
jgi:hypothetical protein